MAVNTPWQAKKAELEQAAEKVAASAPKKAKKKAKKKAGASTTD